MMDDVNVTCVPAHTGFEDALMVILTGRLGLTVMQIVFEFAGFPVGQLMLEVRMQAIQSPFTGI